MRKVLVGRHSGKAVCVHEVQPEHRYVDQVCYENAFAAAHERGEHADHSDLGAGTVQGGYALPLGYGAHTAWVTRDCS